MLLTLSIRDVVVIEGLNLDLGPALTTFTGETGAGKSIILDALGLILGQRGDRDLIRAGAAEAVVSATFAPSADVQTFLASRDLPCEDPLIIRRSVRASGGAQYVNDTPVSVSLLKTLGDLLVEVHGQRDSHALLMPAAQRSLLDRFAAAEPAGDAVRMAWGALQEARAELAAVEALAARADDERLSLSETLATLDRLAPKPGEEADLADERALLMLSETLAGELTSVVAALSQDLTPRLSQGLRGLLRVATKVEQAGATKVERLQNAIASCERAMIEADEAVRSVNDIAASLEYDPQRLQAVDDRLHELRSMARRLGVPVDALETHRASVAHRLLALEDTAGLVATAQAAVTTAEAVYTDHCTALTMLRTTRADALSARVKAELPHLKLDKVDFVVELVPTTPGPEGAEGVRLMARTNPDQPMGPLSTMASGGEFARFALALKAAVATRDGVPTLIFDEVDQGVGGAVAEAVGKRLAHLAQHAQVLVVTHSPQVAAKGTAQIRVEKTVADGATRTTARVLNDAERREEIARMLAGEVITDAARQAADALMEPI
jgi:DNA repair protein RecN (Recombination protein N)